MSDDNASYRLRLSLTHIHTYTHIHTHTYIQTYIHKHTHIHTHKHTHTHTHTHARTHTLVKPIATVAVRKVDEEPCSDLINNNGALCSNSK